MEIIHADSSELPVIFAGAYCWFLRLAGWCTQPKLPPTRSTRRFCRKRSNGASATSSMKAKHRWLVQCPNQSSSHWYLHRLTAEKRPLARRPGNRQKPEIPGRLRAKRRRHLQARFHDPKLRNQHRHHVLLRGQQRRPLQKADQSCRKVREEAFNGAATASSMNRTSTTAAPAMAEAKLAPICRTPASCSTPCRPPATESNDEAVQRALVFVSRCQNLESQYNTTPFAAK